MAKNRKSTGSKKFVATLPYLMAPSDEQIGQMEIQFSLQHLKQASEAEEKIFLDWATSPHREKTYGERFLLSLIGIGFADNPWSGTGNFPYDDPNCWDMQMEDPDLDLRDDCQINDYQASMYWDDDGWDIPQSIRDLEESFCPEQAIVREIPLRGLKHAARKELIREYAVI
jgi:hypothetical protein